MAEKHSYPTMEPLRFLLQMIHNRETALPDFQRDFVWDPAMTDELIESIIQNYPAGTLLRVKTGQELYFQPRAFQGAPELTGKPSYLILDGQQRLTSLYQALYGVGSHRFLLDLAGLEQGLDLEDCAIYDRADRVERGFGSIQQQADALVFPLGRLFTDGGFDRWATDVLRARGGTADELLEMQDRLAKIRSQWIRPIEEYDFPMITVAEETSASAICMIFETLNRTGVKLGVFELLTARFWPKDVRLRALWETAQEQHPILVEFGIDPYYILQIIGLIEPGVDQLGQPRAPSVKRSQILGQTADQAKAGWAAATTALADVLRILREDCGVAASRWLPYGTMVIPAAGAWAIQDRSAKAADVGANRAKLGRWFWCAALGQRYENAPNSQAAKDYVELVRWMAVPGGEEPESVGEFAFHSGTLRNTTPRQRAVYRAVMSLILRRGARDFHKRGSITYSMLIDPANPVDDHHIFPVGYLSPQGVPGTVRDSILNRTLIDRVTNIRIGKRPPSDYLTEIRAAWGSDTEFRALLDSHLLPAGENSPLLTDKFQEFLGWRETAISEEIEELTGTKVVRGEDVEAVHIPRVELDTVPSAPVGAIADGLGQAADAFIDDLIRRRGSDWTAPLATAIAQRAGSFPDVELRAQKSRNEPTYFQVRSPKFKQVVAYVNVAPTYVRVDYRLPESHSTYGIAESRDHFYGISLKVQQDADVETAIQLLRDALERSE